MNNIGPRMPILILPASFDAIELLPKPLRKSADDACYIVSTIMRKNARGKADSNGFVQLRSEYIRNIISKRKATEIVDSLLDAGAIHRKPYRPGVRSFGYRLDVRYSADPHIRVPIECKRLLRKIEDHSIRYRKVAEKRMKPVHHALKLLQRGLDIDPRESGDIVARLRPESNRFDVQGILVRDIYAQQFRFSVGNFGRVANSITCLKREIRTALRCGGRPLVGVDISCAQPCLLSLLIRWYERSVPSRYGLDIVLPAVVPPSCPSIAEFSEACLSGALFDLIGVALRNAGHDWTRQKIKKRFLTDVLAKKKANKAGAEYPSVVESIFIELFPGVWKFVRDVNHSGWEHARLIRLLQQMEAGLVIEQVCGHFVQQYPGEFLISLHDAVYCRPEMLDKLIATFHHVFAKLDFRPKLRPTES